MASHALCAMSLRSALLRLSLFILAMGALLPAQGRAQCTTTGNVTTCTSSGGITLSSTLNASEGSSISVPSLPGTVTAISLTLNSLNVTNLNSIAIVLVPPSGSGLTALDLFSGICGSGSQQVGSSTFTLADTGATGTDNVHGMVPYFGGTCPSTLSGTYLPTDYFPGQDTFNSPGPGTSYNSAGISAAGMTNCQGLTGVMCGSYDFTSGFGLPSAATNLEGTWTLYIANQVTPAGSGSLGSWTITFTTTAATATTTSISASPNGSTSLVYTSSDVHGDATTPTSVTLTANVSASGSTVDAGTVTFYDSTGTSAGSGTVLASGVAVSSGVAETNVTFPGTEEGPRSISAVYSGASGSYAASTSSTATVLTTNHPYNPSTGTFCNGPITVNNTGAGTPYPSLLALGTGNSQLQGTIESVTVSLNNISLQNDAELANLGFLLQAPGSNTMGTGSSGNAFQFLSWAGNPFSSGSLTMSDAGTAQIPPFSAPACTTCLATDNWIDVGSDNSDTFPSPAPSTFSTAAPTGSATFTTEFGGQGANNTWSLYLDTRIVEPGSAGTIGSWCLNFTMQANAHPTATSVSGSPNPASFTPPATTASVALTANVSVTDSSGLTVNAGTVTFVDGSTNLGSGTVTNGVATLNTTLTEGTHQIVATYSGTDTGTEFGISTGKYDQRVDTATTNPSSGSGAGPYTYCNSGSITTPGLGADAGAASPYPSNIFVTNLPGTVDAVTVTLTNFSTKDQGDLLSLLVGPGGNNLDFFSLTGSNVSSAPTINLNFSDTASSNIPQGSSGNLSSSGTFKPTSYNTNITFPQCPPNASSCASPPVGPPLASNPFTPTNKAATAGTAILGNANEAGVFGGTSSSTYNGNGTWSLYMNDGGPTGGGEVTNIAAWCVSLTENLPSVSVNKSHSGDFTQGQQGVPFTVNITNNGPGPTGDPTAGKNPLTVTDTLNSAFSYASSSGTGWSCSPTGQTVTCTNDSAVAQGSSYSLLAINVNVSPTASTTTSVPNQVSVSGGGVTNATSNTDSVIILPAPVLAVQKSHTGTFTQGQTDQWSITVSNTATGSLTNGTITASDTLPTGYTLNSYTSTGTATWNCSGVGTVTCTTSGGIAGGTDSVINLTVDVPATSPVSVTNTVKVWGGGDLTHTSLATAASATDTATVVQVPASVSINNGGGTQSVNIGTAFPIPLSVTVEDANSVVIPSYTVTFTASTGGNGQSGTFSNSTNTIQITTNGSGVANAGTFTANNNAGSYTVTAMAGSASATFNLTNNQLTQTITFPSLSTPVTYGVGAITLAATASSNLPVSYSVTGPATISGSTLTITGAGTVMVTASQAGNANYQAATPVSQTITVNKATPSLTWPTPAPISYGTALSGTQLDASATGVGGTSLPGGFAYTPVAGTVLNAGPQTLQTTFTPTDSTDYNTASTSVTLTVNQASQTITFPAISSPVTYGVGPITLAATASSNLPVSYSVTGPATISGSMLTITGAGSVVVTASQAGNTNYQAATPVSQTITVNQATPTLTWPTPAPISYGTALSSTQLDASATGVGGTSLPGAFAYIPPAGTVLAAGSRTLQVTFTPTDTTDYKTASTSVTLTVNQVSQTITFPAISSPVTYGVGPITLAATASSGLAVSYTVTGPATISGSTLTITGSGSVVVTASQAGNTNYTAATPVSQTVMVNQAVLMVTASNESRAYGAPNPTFAYTITGFVNNDPPTVVSGTPLLSTTATSTSPPGTYPITVTAGTLSAANYSFTFVNGTLTINQTPQTITFPALSTPVTYGVGPIALAATASSGLPVSYSVTGPATISGSTLTITGAGSIVASAMQAGNTDYTAATPVSQTVTVAKAPLTVTPANETKLYGAAVPTLTGVITGLVNGDNITATYATTATAASPVGTYPITATLNDPADRLPNYSVTLNQGTLTVTQNALTVTANNATKIYGTANPTFTGTVTGAVNGDIFTESFATEATISSPVGTYPIVPSVTGVNLSNYVETIVNGTLTVTQATTTTTLSTSNANANLNASVTFTATIASATTGTPTGSVEFLDGSTVLGTSPVNAQGVATYSTNALAAGTHIINAIYSGDQNFKMSSATVNQQVTVPTAALVLNPSTLTLKQGQSGVVMITYTPMAGYKGSITFSCNGLPIWAACSFQPLSVTADGSNTPLTTQLTIKTLGPNVAAMTDNTIPSSHNEVARAAFCLFPSVLMGILLYWQRRKLSAASKHWLIVLMLLIGTVGVIGCGFPEPDTPVSSSAVTITATPVGGSVQSTILTLNITK